LDNKKPTLIIEAPPQHGKTLAVSDFIAWIAGKNPDFRTIYTSYSSNLGESANKRIQRILSSDVYNSIFPETRLAGKEDRAYSKNLELLDFVGKDGSFRNTTVGGQITGMSLDFGVIDDPIKG